MVRIRWGSALDASLHHRFRDTTGKWGQLVTCWNRKYPNLVTTSCALQVRHSRLTSGGNRRMTSGADSNSDESGWDSSSDDSEDEEWQAGAGSESEDEPDLWRPTHQNDSSGIRYWAGDHRILNDKVSDGAVGDFKGRDITPSARGKNVNPSLLQLVDELVDLQVSEPTSDLFNCS